MAVLRYEMLMGWRVAGLFLQWSKALASVLFVLSSQHCSVAALRLRGDWTGYPRL